MWGMYPSYGSMGGYGSTGGMYPSVMVPPSLPGMYPSLPMMYSSSYGYGSLPPAGSVGSVGALSGWHSASVPLPSDPTNPPHTLASSLAETLESVRVSGGARTLVLGAVSEAGSAIVAKLSSSSSSSSEVFYAPVTGAEGVAQDRVDALAASSAATPRLAVAYDAPAFFLAAGLGDITFLVLVPTPGPEMEAQIGSVLESAVEAKVGYVVLVSHVAAAVGVGAESPLLAAFAAAELATRGSGIPYTILRAAPLVQDLYSPPRLGSNGSLALGDESAAYLDARDLAAVVGAVLEAPADHVKKTYVLTGPALLSGADVASALADVLPSPPTRVSIAEASLSPLALEEERAALAGDLAVVSPHVERVVGSRPSGILASLSKDLNRVLK